MKRIKYDVDINKLADKEIERLSKPLTIYDILKMRQAIYNATYGDGSNDLFDALRGGLQSLQDDCIKNAKTVEHPLGNILVREYAPLDTNTTPEIIKDLRLLGDIGVICLDQNDFNNFIKQNDFMGYHYQNLKHFALAFNRGSLWRISSVLDMHSCTYDIVVMSDNAEKNPEYNEIVEEVKHHIKVISKNP